MNVATGRFEDLTAYDVIGSGTDALVLPSLSSVSTRREMHPLAQRLGDRFKSLVVDWPGFGEARRAGRRLKPDTMHQFLESLCREPIVAPAIGIAAGHGAGYLVAAALRHRGRFARLVLIAPTWRGPLPTMFGGRRQAFCRRVRATLEAPLIGSLLYRLNVSRPIVARMMREHVYADPAHVTAEVLDAKRAVTRRPDGRFGTAAFVTGGLDPVGDRVSFMDLLRGDLPPILVVRPERAPRRSGAEMDALAAIPGVSITPVRGALLAHEEYPDDVATALRAFCGIA